MANANTPKRSSSTSALRSSGAASTKKSAEKGLQDLLEHGLKDIYYAEKKIHKTLPKMIKAAHDPELKSGFEKHREETAGQIERLEQIFELLGKRARAEKCEAIDGILEEGDGLIEDFGETAAGDAALIFSGQAVEHYEITRYGSLHSYAVSLGMDEIAELIEQSLDEEKNTDEKLSKIAQTRVNHAAEAVSGSSEDDDEDEDAAADGDSKRGRGGSR